MADLRDSTHENHQKISVLGVSSEVCCISR